MYSWKRFNSLSVHVCKRDIITVISKCLNTHLLGTFLTRFRQNVRVRIASALTDAHPSFTNRCYRMNKHSSRTHTHTHAHTRTRYGTILSRTHLSDMYCPSVFIISSTWSLEAANWSIPEGKMIWGLYTSIPVLLSHEMLLQTTQSPTHL